MIRKKMAAVGGLVVGLAATAPISAAPQEAEAPRTIEFPSSDGLLLTADLWAVDADAPTLLLFHQSASSRGEFATIGPWVARLGFNALAVDLRWGRTRNGVLNQTAKRHGTEAIIAAVEAGTGTPWPAIDASYDDMRAALAWLNDAGFDGPRWVLGSSFSAMLVFRLAAEAPVDAVIAYSPAEYDPNEPRRVRDHAARIGVPAYLVAAPGEGEAARGILDALTDDEDRSRANSDTPGPRPPTRLFEAPAGVHGASILDADRRTRDDLAAFLAELYGGLPVRRPVVLESSDGVAVHADVYAGSAASSAETPVVLLFHQGGGSGRGEYGFLVPWLRAAGFDLVVADLRRGGARFGFPNRSVEALGGPDPAAEAYTYCDARHDVRALRRWADERWPNRHQVLWGSSFSAALVLIDAADHPENVAGVLAFSPASGEPMAGCTPEASAASLTAPALVVRPDREAALPSVAEQLRTFERLGIETWIAAPGTHGSSTLHRYRVDGDPTPTRDRVRTFLDRLSGG